MEIAHFRWRLLERNRIGQTVENRSGSWRSVTAQPARDLFCIYEKAGGLVEFILRYELAGPIHRFRVLFDGDTDDARQTLCWIFLGGQRGGRDKREDQDTDPPRKSTIHCRVNLSGIPMEAIGATRQNGRLDSTVSFADCRAHAGPFFEVIHEIL